MSQPDDARQPASQPGRLERIGRSVSDSPIFQVLTEVAGQFTGYALEAQHPGASAVVPATVTSMKAGIAVTLNAMKQRRVRMLNASLVGSGVELTADVIQSEKFLHAYEATLRATLHTRREEKITLFARLLANATQGANVADVDEFEELLGILDDLSLRELIVLARLEEWLRIREDSRAQRDERVDPDRAEEQAWEKFRAALIRDARIDGSEFRSFMIRLGRTGCFELSYGILGGPGERGAPTPLFHRLRQLIQDREGNVIEPDASDAD